MFKKVIDFLEVFNNNNYYFDFKIKINDKEFNFIKNCLFKNNLLSKRNHSINAVYFIKNMTDGKVYIGSTNDICTRVSHHKSDLIFKKHRNKLLQESFNNTNNAKHWFDICVIFTNTREEAYDLEQYLLDYFKDDINKCNKALNSRLSGLGLPMSDKAKINMSKVQKGIIRSTDTRLRLSLGHLSNNDSNYKISNDSNTYKQLTINGIKYLSIRQASEQLHICRKYIKRRLNDPNNHNYIFS